jgi:hypothetical protein
MKFAWTIRLAPEDAGSLATIRLHPGVEVALAPDALWVRGRGTEDARLDQALRSLPAVERYEWLGGDQLRPLESRIPSDTLPALRWEPLAQWFGVELPSCGLSAEPPRPTSLRLVRSTNEADPNVLLTTFREWSRFALQAAEIRLQRLRFAVSNEATAVIWGRPLPPTTGGRFVEQSGIAVPAGFTWRPAVTAAILRQVFRVAEQALVLWHLDGSVTNIHPEQFVAAGRGAVRETAKGLETIP